jgi:hypothetical protein
MYSSHFMIEADFSQEHVENFGQDVMDECNGLEITLPDAQSAVAGGYNRTSKQPVVPVHF